MEEGESQTIPPPLLPLSCSLSACFRLPLLTPTAHVPPPPSDSPINTPRRLPPATLCLKKCPFCGNLEFKKPNSPRYFRTAKMERTPSMDSNDGAQRQWWPSADKHDDENENAPRARRLSYSEMILRNGMGENAPTGRRLSFTEMILGSPGKGGFSWGQGLLERKLSKDGGDEKKSSITNEERFKELMKRESEVLNDEGTFSRKNYMKS